MPEYQYDVFISYSSEDRPWALKLANSLKGRGVNVFLDNQRLELGKAWEPNLTQAVHSSQHLIALWSGNAKESEWVRRELGAFEARINPNVINQDQVSHRFIFLMLEGANAAYTGFQSVNDLKDAQAYQKDAPEKGADVIAPSEWQDVVDKIAGAIKKDDPAVFVPLAILSMTEQDLRNINANQPLRFVPSLNDLLKNIGVGTADDLLANNYYGQNRTDWRPFGSELNVRQILDNMLMDVNNAIPPPHFRWEPIDEAFWTDPDVAKRERDKLLANLSVIVIDPLSLYDVQVFESLNFLRKCVDSDRAVIMVLTPFSMPSPFVSLSKVLEIRGDALYDPYWNPPIPYVNPYAQLGMNIGDERGIRRMLRRSLGSYVRKAQPQSIPEYLKQGRG